MLEEIDRLEKRLERGRAKLARALRRIRRLRKRPAIFGKRMRQP